MLHFQLWSCFVNSMINHVFSMFAVSVARSGPHMWVLCSPQLDASDGTSQFEWSSGTTANIYVFISAQLLWSTWNALILSCCHIYCCFQFLKLLLWSGTRWSCYCDLLLWFAVMICYDHFVDYAGLYIFTSNFWYCCCYIYSLDPSVVRKILQTDVENTSL